MPFETFSRWLERHPAALGLSQWLLAPGGGDGLETAAGGNAVNGGSLVSTMDDAPTFYQTLAGVTHLEETEIVELERRFWALAAL